MKRALQLLATIAVVALMGVAMPRLAWSDVSVTLRCARWPLLIVVTLMNAPYLALRVERWRLLLARDATIPRRRLWQYMLAASGASVALPMRAGETLRPYLLRRDHGVAVTSSLRSLVAEKIFDAIGLVLVLAPLPFVVALPLHLDRGIVAATAMLAVAGIVWRVSTRVDRQREVALSIGLSTAMWLVDALRIHCLLIAVGIDVPWFAPSVITLLLNLSLVVPALPGNVGTFEAGATAGLVVFGVQSETALAFALLHHALQVVPTVIGGIVSAIVLLARTKPLMRAQ